MRDEFKHPSAHFRAKPFWAWNGSLEEEEIKRQVDVMKAMGFGGFFIHSRVGLETEYLGEKWFDIINSCADYAEGQGLEAWIYDEDRWPSGSAGGKATALRENRIKFIRMNTGRPEWSGNVIAAFSCRLDGVSVFDVKRIYPEDSIKGDIIWFDIAEGQPDSNYNGTTYLDTMKKSATEEFIRCTHEKYASHCKQRLGTSIKGVFTDEPVRGEMMMNSMRYGLEMSVCAPYTETIFDVFLDMWGYDLKDYLPQLFLLENGNRVSQVKWHYCETIQRLFLDNFVKPIAKWCDDYNMKLTGHMLHEDSLSAQTIPNGSLMRNYELMQSPGVDILGRRNYNYHVVKQLSSVGRQTGKKQLLSELYGCSGWQMSFEDYKHIGDWQALLGINLRCPHLSWYTMAGENKRDCPGSIFFQSAWYKEYRYLEDYYARLAVFSSIGEGCCETLVINPVESMWCCIYKGWAEWLNTTDDFLKKIDEKHIELCRVLLENNVEFDYGDEDMLFRLGRVEQGRLYVGNVSYSRVIIPAMITMRSTTLSLLKEFEAGGGSVVFADEAPSYIDALPCEVPKGSSDMKSIYDTRIVTVDNKSIFTSVKKDEKGDYYIMLLNVDAENPASGSITMPEGATEQWIPKTGASMYVPRFDEIQMHPGEMRLYRVSAAEEGAAVAAEALPEVIVPEKFEYETDEPNVLVLDMATCKFKDKCFRGDVLKIDRAIRGECKLPYRGGAMYQPWYIKKRGIKDYFKVRLEYCFESEIETDAFLAVEQPERCKLTFNSQQIGKECGWWVDPCFKKIKVHIRKGTNTLMLEAMYSDDFNVEAVYVLGEFGVYNNRIGKKPSKLKLGDIREQGFPYYGGKLKYIFDCEVKEKSLLRLKGMYGAAVVKVNGAIVAWQPYEAELEPCNQIEIELMLTRRNTFGPLHCVPAVLDGTDSGSFCTEGDKYSEEPVTIPCGFYR